MNRELRRLTGELKDESAYVRREAARALAAYDPGPQRRRLSSTHRRTTGALVRVMGADADEFVRLAAAEALTGYTDLVAREAVLGLLRSAGGGRTASDFAVRVLELNAPEPVFRAAVAFLLRGDGSADLGSVDQTDLLIALMEEGATDADGDRSSVIPAVARRLAETRDERAIPPLVRELLNDNLVEFDSIPPPRSPQEFRQRAEQERTLWFVRSGPDADGVLSWTPSGSVGRAVITFGARAGEAILEAVRAAPRLSDYTLGHAVSVLAEIADAAPATITAGLAATEPAVVRLAAGAVRGVFHADWLPGLVAAAGSSEANVRATALAALGRIVTSRPAGDDALEAAGRCLLDHITDDAPGPRRAALEALRDVAPRTSAAARHVEALVVERPMLLPRIVAALASDPRVIEILARLIRGGTPDQRRYGLIAVREAAPLAPAPFVYSEPLESAVTVASADGDPTLRSLAAAAAGALLDERQPTGAFATVPAAPPSSSAGPSLSKKRRSFRLPLPRWRRRRKAIVKKAEGGVLISGGSVASRDVRWRLSAGLFEPTDLGVAGAWSTDRYPDVSLFTDAPEPQPVPSEVPLLEATWYRVGVAIRGEVHGLPLSAGERAPFPDLPGTGDTARLLLAADSDDFEIEDPLGHITLPTAAGDSVEDAWFRVRARRATPAGESSRIELRLYYEYNLVEVILIEAQVRPRLATAGLPAAGGAPTLATIQVSRERNLEDLGEIAPRAMNIGVERDGDRYALTFAFPGESGETVLRGVTAVDADDLDSALVSVRELWRDIALSSPFVDEVKPSTADADRELRRLVDAGWRLWTMLFRLRAGSGLARIGELLASHPLPSGAKIQISVGAQAGSFSFPWGLLYDRDPPARGERPDPEGFWGARYVIEQGVPGLMRARDTAYESYASSLEFAYMLWNRFRNAHEHGLMLAGLVTSARGRLRISAPPILDADTCLDLLSHASNDILYFYTHGFTRRRRVSTSDTEELNRLKHWYETLDAADPRRISLRSLYETLTDAAPIDRSYISFPFSRLYLDDLYGRIAALRTAPTVLLNMCESAQVSPTLSDSFVHFFLSRGARSVIGTECPMTVAFAHPFAADLLSRLFRGSPIGKSLLAARQSFLQTASNPLGLAYTLYGSAATSFIPPLLDASVQDLDHERSTA